MKGPEEREQTSACSPEWLVEKSRQALESGDQFAAKSWLLTAKTLHPRAFSVQYEAFQMEKRSGKLVPCGRLFLEMIKLFPKQEILWKELKRIVKSQEFNASELDSESRFLREMSESLPVKFQRELLLKYADHQTDLVEKCRISLVVMKKFHGGTRQYGLKLTELLMHAELEETVQSPLNIYRKLLVCDVVPLMLRSTEVHVESGPKRKTNAIYLPESHLLKWLELSMEYFVTSSIQQSTLRSRHFDKTYNYATEHIADGEVMLGGSSWQLLCDNLLLFATKCGWNNILKTKDKIDPAKNKSMRNRWRAINNIKDTKNAWGIFFCALQLFFFAVIEYSARMVTQVKGQINSKGDEFLLLEYLDHTEIHQETQQNSSRTPKKKRKLGDGSIATTLDSQFSNEDSCSSSGSDLIDFLHVAIDCRQFIESNPVFSKEFTRIFSDWRVGTWEWMEIIEIDSLIYQRKYQDVIDVVKAQHTEQNSKKAASKKHLAKQYTQMSMCLYSIGEKKEACQMALNAVYAISDPVDPEIQSRDSNAATKKSIMDGRYFQKLPCSQREITAFSIDLFISCLKEKLSSVDIRPDQDKIGPLYDIRQDNIIGHLIVLLQFDWPKGEDLFEQLVKTVITLGGLRYEKFFAYVINIDILEEFSYLNSLEKVQLELQGSVPGESSRKTVTRGVNRENREDFRTAMDSQVKRSNELVQNLILKFLKDEQQSILALG